jgi:hypothetical protein
MGTQLKVGAISTVVTLLGQGDIFSRVKSEIQRTNEAMPDASGKDKRAKFLADCQIIFNDLLQPIIEAELRILLELGIKFLAAEALISAEQQV